MEERKTFNAQLRQIIHTMENSLNQKLDGLRSEIDQKFDNLQNSISRLTNQHVHQEEESLEEECLSDTMVEGSGKEAGEEPKKLILQPIPIKLNPSATAQATKIPLLAAPSTDHVYLVYILLAAQPIPEEPAPAVKARAIPHSLPIQYFRKLVASV